jgi:hypothetical protein
MQEMGIYNIRDLNSVQVGSLFDSLIPAKTSMLHNTIISPLPHAKSLGKKCETKASTLSI